MNNLRARLQAAILHHGQCLQRGSVVELPSDRVRDLVSRGVAVVVPDTVPLTKLQPSVAESVASVSDLPADEKAEIDQAVETVVEGWTARSRRSEAHVTVPRSVGADASRPVSTSAERANLPSSSSPAPTDLRSGSVSRSSE